MTAYNFKARFADDVASGAKPCTIRPRRKHPTKVGDRLQLYTGMRTRVCRKLRPDVIVERLTPITIRTDGIELDGRELTQAEQEALAAKDGRCTLEEFRALFAEMYSLPTKDMELIEWDPAREVTP